MAKKKRKKQPTKAKSKPKSSEHIPIPTKAISDSAASFPYWLLLPALLLGFLYAGYTLWQERKDSSEPEPESGMAPISVPAPYAVDVTFNTFTIESLYDDYASEPTYT